MQDQNKTKDRISGELAELRRRVAEMEATLTQATISNGRLQLVNLLKGDLVQTGSPNDKLKLITDSVVRIFEADFARIWIINPGDRCDSGCVHAEATEGPHVCHYRDRCLHLMESSGRYTHVEGQMHCRVPFDCYKIGRIASGSEPSFMTNDVVNDPRVHDHAWAKNLGLVSAAGYRILARTGAPIGVLALFSKRLLSSDDHFLLEGIANTTAHVFQTAAAEAALKTSERKYRMLYDVAPIGIVLVDTEGKILEVNRSFLDVLGSPSPEATKSINMLTFPLLVKAGVSDLFRICMTENRLIDSELLYTSKWGKETYLRIILTPKLNEHGHIEGCLAVMEDVMPRKLAEQALKESEEKYKALVETTNTGYLILDSQGNITDANSEYIRLSGHKTLDEIIGRSVVEWTAEHDRERNTAEVAKCLQQGSIQGLEIDYVDKEGRITPVEISATVLRIGESSQIVALCRDISDRKRTENALRDSESRLRSLMEAIPDALVVYDDMGRVTFVNKPFEELYGWSKEELVGKRLTNFVPPSQEEITRQAWERTLRGVKVVFETQRWTKEGKVLDLQLSTAILRNMDGKHTASIVIHRDITSRKMAEEELHKSEQKYRHIFDYSPLGILHFDYEGTITACNDNFVQIIGSSREKLVGLNMINDLKDVQIVAAVKRTLSGEASHYEGEYASVTADKVTPVKVDFSPLLDESGLVVGGIGITEDITDRKRAEENLQKSEKFLEQVVENLPDMIFVKDAENLRFVRFNKAGEDLLGYSQEDLLGKNDYDFFPLEQADYFITKDREVLASGNLVEIDEEEVDTRLKGKRILHTKKIPVLDANGTPQFLLGISEDITERQLVEKERELLKSQLFQAQKMEAVGTLAGGIAHDFNNLLQAITGYTELLMMRKKQGDPDLNDLERIYDSTKRGADLVKSLMMFSRKTKPGLHPVDLNREIVEVQKILSKTIPKTIKIDLRLSGQVESINADRSQIGQVLMNLGVNARDAMPDGGTLTIETENVQLDNEYCSDHLEAIPGSYVLLTVSDNGQGMDRKTLSHIFEPFFSTKEVGKGTGLGLATVYGIVKQHSGHITCDSELGHGTSFKIYLPAIQTKKDIETQIFEAAIPGGTETILLVDDDDYIRDLGTELLNEFGYNVITANDGKQALEIYQRESESISLIILDLIMPEMDGRKCLAEILRVNPSAKVIIASGYSENGPADGCMEAGAQGFVPKPYNMRQFLTTIREILDKD